MGWNKLKEAAKGLTDAVTDVASDAVADAAKKAEELKNDALEAGKNLTDKADGMRLTAKEDAVIGAALDFVDGGLHTSSASDKLRAAVEDYRVE